MRAPADEQAGAEQDRRCDSSEPAISAKKWPSRYAERDVGSDRKRSITPSWRSVAIDIAGPIIPKARVWMRMPPIRYSL